MCPEPPPTCAKCGACSTVCPVYRVTGREYHTGRGKLHLLARLDPATASAAYADILSRCLLCGACSAVCPRKIPVAEELAAARARLNRRAGEQVLLRRLAGGMLESPRLLKLLPPLLKYTEYAALGRLPEPGAGLNGYSPLNQHLVGPGERLPTIQPPAPYLFAGCYGNYLDPGIKLAVASLLGKVGLSPPRPAQAACCGLTAHSSGRLAEAQRLARLNIAAHPGPAPIVVSCASCAAHLSRYPELLADDEQWRERAEEFAARINEFSHFLHQAAPEQRSPVTVTGRLKVLYHDPCHLRFALKISQPPRKLLARLPKVELVELPRGPRCCGQGGLFHLAHPAEARAILAELAADFRESGAAVVTSSCSGCLLHWQKARNQQLHQGRVVHLATLLDQLT